jgi:osmotically-inducible protein OsmY
MKWINFQKLIIFVILATVTPAVYAKNTSSDKNISETIHKLLLEEKDIPTKNITITTLDGIVGVRGVVDTTLQAHKIIEIASSVEGVIDVYDVGLEVNSSDNFFEDAVITAKVKGKIRYLMVHNKISKGYELHVETTNKVVHVFGKVAKKSDISVIKMAIQSIKGVSYVNTNIEVNR